jgi:uncharacterized membrane protein
MKSHLNAAGVVLTVIGAILIWVFLGELNFVNKAEYLKGHGVLKVSDPEPDDIGKFKRDIWLSRVGMVLIVLGGVLQVISNYCEN